MTVHSTDRPARRPRAPRATPPAAPRSARQPTAKRPLRVRIWRERWMYAFFLPGVVFFVVFAYVPLLGNAAAFQDYSPFLGFRGSPWVGLANFHELFSDPQALAAIRNTLIISLLQVVFAFPAPIALALLLNSLISPRIKRIVQSIVYLPHFIGWVIVISIWQNVLGDTGGVNQLFSHVGMSTAHLMTDASTFKGLLTAQVIWKETGWGTIIFFAAISHISTDLYEAAVVDGAGPWRRTWHITLPGIANVIALLLILRMGDVLTVGFEQILLQQNAVGNDAAQVVDTFVYYNGVLGGNWGLATAAGIFKGVVGTVLVVVANRTAKRFGTSGVF